MVLELHVWGPAFELASIDAQCLAAIAYFEFCLPDDNDWVIIPSLHPTNANPFYELPALRDDELWVVGLKNIISYLKEISNGDWDLDKGLSERQRADSIAFQSFIVSRGATVTRFESLDDSASVARPSEKRSAHLGLDGLDVDIATEDTSKNDGVTDQIPKSLRKPKQTVSGLLGRNAQTNRFRIDAVTSDFLEPLNDLLGGKDWLIGEECTTLDCLALGYLILMREPQLTHAWLKDAMRTKYSELDDWTRRLGREFLSRREKAQKDSFDKARSPTDFSSRWQKPIEKTWTEIGQAIFDNCLISLPGIGSKFVVTEVKPIKISGKNKHQNRQLAVQQLRNQQMLYSRIMATGVGVFIVFGTMLWNGWFVFPRRTGRSSTRTFGEAGAILGLG